MNTLNVFLYFSSQLFRVTKKYILPYISGWCLLLIEILVKIVFSDLNLEVHYYKI